MTEADLAKFYIDELKADGWVVYQEACVPDRADIVAVKKKTVRVIEAKTRISFNLITQGLRWLATANEVYLLTPRPRNEWDMRPILAKLGLGWLILSEYEHWCHKTHGRITEREIKIPVESPFNSSADTNDIIKRLDERMKDYAAAGTSGTYWTPFKRTVERITAYVKARPKGVTARELEAGIEHHYDSPASARGNFIQIVERGLIPGVKLDRSSKLVLFKPEKGKR